MEFGHRARSTPLGTVLDRLDQSRTVAYAASVPAETEEGKASVQRLNEDLTGRIGRLKSILRRGLDPEVSGTSRARSQDSSAQNLATNNRLAAARDDFERAKADYDRAEARRARSGCTNKRHATRQLCRRVTQRARSTQQSHSANCIWLAKPGPRKRSVVPRVGTVANVAPRRSSAHGGDCLLAAGRTGCRPFELPPAEVIPAVDSYTYMSTTSTLREKKRPKAEIAQLDRSVVS
jgi:hypothetical protein